MPADRLAQGGAPIDSKSFDITADSRLLLLAPHPDDEALAMAGLLQRAAACGASVFVAFLTDGEDNPWPQRAADRRWRIGPRERAHWGARRRKEALRALRTLGFGADAATFLGFPDQRLTALLLAGDPGLARALVELHGECRPTHVVAPSAQDHHPDHSALAVAARAASTAWRPDEPARLFEYIVHDRSQRPAGRTVRLRLTREEQSRKRRAIECHASQLIFRRHELMTFVTTHEAYHEVTPFESDEPHHPISRVDTDGEAIAIQLQRAPNARAFGPATVQLLFPGLQGSRRVLSLPLPWLTARTPIRHADGRAYPHPAEYAGGPFRGVLRIPLAALPRLEPGYVKLESRYGFFDEAGWRRLPALDARGRRVSAAAAGAEPGARLNEI